MTPGVGGETCSYARIATMSSPGLPPGHDGQEVSSGICDARTCRHNQKLLSRLTAATYCDIMISQ
jgi:hypothetical protein